MSTREVANACYAPCPFCVDGEYAILTPDNVAAEDMPEDAVGAVIHTFPMCPRFTIMDGDSYVYQVTMARLKA